MPTLPRTQPELRWSRPLPAPPRRAFAMRAGAGANSAEGKAFVHGDTLWVCPGTLGREPQSSQWPALIGLDLATGEDRVRVPMPAGGLEAQAAPAGSHIALVTRNAKALDVSLVDRASGGIEWRMEIPVERADRAFNPVVLFDGGTLLVSCCEMVPLDERTSEGRYRCMAIRDGRIVWRNENAGLLGVYDGVALTAQVPPGGGYDERALSVADGTPLWTRAGRQPFGIFAGMLVSKHLTPKGPQRFPAYTIACADPRTGVDRWSYERDSVIRFAWGDHHLAAGVDDGQPLVVLDEHGKVIVEEPHWANPGKADPRAVAALDGDSLLWLGSDAAGKNATRCSPLMDPGARRWSIPDGLFAETTVFFDGGFVNLLPSKLTMFFAKADG